MSQSNFSYGTKQPKGIAHEHRHQQPATTDDTAEADIEPACWRHSASDWKWHEVQFTAAYAAIHDPCSECFPAGAPEIGTLETVVRSCSYPVKYHRVRDGDETDPVRESREADDCESEAGAQFGSAAINASESISSITELRKGDGVLWQGQSTPLVVAEPATTPDGTVSLIGPNGGEYRIEGRPECARAYYISPGYACQRELRRVVPASDHPQLERA
ncbi:hypothetical protein [Halococcus sediminicola]|uniref:hypothetical protein n=1 Tax=Halococcus sediminicola TaxID=1264579 RepID=UPI0012AB4304|nr:hypothetical protein [Halococcus sediminicola]